MMKRIRNLAFAALTSSLAVTSSLWAQAEEPAAPAGKNYILCYFLVGLGVVLGLVVILDGFVRFGYRVLRRTESGSEWVRAMAKTFSNHVILCGLGRVGLRILEQLIHLGEHVVILEKNPDNQNVVFAEKHGVPVRIGGGREEGPQRGCEIAGERVKLLMVRPEPGNGAPGEVLDDGLLVACGDGALRLMVLQRAGKGAMDAAVFQNGFPVPCGSQIK